MEGEFGDIERAPETPTSILGEELFVSLKTLLPLVMTGRSLNAGKIFKNAEDGLQIRFYNTDGSELTENDWAIVKNEASGIFSGLKSIKYADQQEYSALEISFIDVDDDGKRQVVIKPNLKKFN